MTQRPLSEGNRFQRWYAAWATPFYNRMPAEQRAEAERLDRWPYSRGGAGFWLGLLAAITGNVFGLRSAGLPDWLAGVVSLAVWVGLTLAALGAWMFPEKFTARRLLRVGVMTLSGMVLGLLAGFFTARIARHGGLKMDTLGQALVDLFWKAAPALMVFGFAITALVWLVATSRRWKIQRELRDLRLTQERDAAARQATEAQLKLLQGQIRPHFIFNTLSALQHWVDTSDARAGPLLRSLTAFLRGSTDLLGRDEVRLAEEAAMAGHYLAIMQARLGPRLRHSIDIASDAAEQRLPPGLLLTLVENAIEHGLAPSLSSGEVRVTAAREGGRWKLSVLDDGTGLATGWHEGVGLANCRQRLQHRLGTRASLLLRSLQPGTEACLTVEDVSPGG
jgi:hypothetical protein